MSLFTQPMPTGKALVDELVERLHRTQERVNKILQRERRTREALYWKTFEASKLRSAVAKLQQPKEGA